MTELLKELMSLTPEGISRLAGYIAALKTQDKTEPQPERRAEVP